VCIVARVLRSHRLALAAKAVSLQLALATSTLQHTTACRTLHNVLFRIKQCTVHTVRIEIRLILGFDKNQCNVHPDSDEHERPLAAAAMGADDWSRRA